MDQIQKFHVIIGQSVIDKVKCGCVGVWVGGWVAGWLGGWVAGWLGGSGKLANIRMNREILT